MHTHRRKKDKKEKHSRERPISHAEFDVSGEDIGDIAKQFGISADLIRRMQSHSGRIENEGDKHESEKYL